MNVKTFQATSMHEALRLIQQEFGPEATVLDAATKPRGVWDRIWGKGLVEVTAMRPPHQHPEVKSVAASKVSTPPQGTPAGPSFAEEYRQRFKSFADNDQTDSLLEAMIDGKNRLSNQLPSSLFGLYNQLIDQDVDDRFARELIEEVQRNSTPADLDSGHRVQEKVHSILTKRIRTTPQFNTYQERRVVALIGPTGVGKTTTIAKLAANLAIHDKRRVGLITVDTYRIAAVEQLRAYAQIMDLPMEVVTTPREMRNAISKLSELDFILIDTAGRSSHDDIQIQELRSMLAEAHPDDVQLVLSAVASSRHLTRLVEQFRPTNPTTLLLTKMDEAISFGHLLPIVCGALPLSYSTHGQNVPDDIQAVQPQRLVESILG